MTIQEGVVFTGRGPTRNGSLRWQCQGILVYLTGILCPTALVKCKAGLSLKLAWAIVSLRPFTTLWGSSWEGWRNSIHCWFGGHVNSPCGLASSHKAQAGDQESVQGKALGA